MNETNKLPLEDETMDDVAGGIVPKTLKPIPKSPPVASGSPTATSQSVAIPDAVLCPKCNTLKHIPALPDAQLPGTNCVKCGFFISF